jgi:hypothetical protein
MHHKRQSSEECGVEGREERGLGSSVLLNIKGTKQNGKKSGKNGNKESVPQQMWRDIPNIL